MDVGQTKIKEENSRTFWVWNSAIEDEIMSVMPDSHVDDQKNQYHEIYQGKSTRL